MMVSVRVNKQEYFGKPAIVVLMADTTKKIHNRLHAKHAQEKEQQAQHAENFKSTVSHEMRTPLESILFFVRQIQAFIEKLLLNAAFAAHFIQLEQTQKYLQMVTAQLMLMKTFVDDLLDIHQLKEGLFVLEKAIFNPNETFQFLCTMLQMQA